ncbi:uncharacterized protein LOC143886997 [Tasmannia lanceolata]|uniref:uncharacterized protein LOC143886997 n=1 Tax=Tasmannia lanceolata TaxID=3420 RepID=UPI004063F0B5
MDTRSQAVQSSSYEDFVPSSFWVEDEGYNTHLFDLPGFARNQLRVQLDSSGNIILTGERPLGGNKWSRFRKEFRVPDNCNMNEIHAKFENGTLFVIMPKTISRIDTKAQPTSIKESQEIQEVAKDRKSVRDHGETEERTEKSNKSVNDKQTIEKTEGNKKDQSDGSTKDVGKALGSEMLNEEEKRSEVIDGGKMVEGKKTDAIPGTQMRDRRGKKHGEDRLVTDLADPKQLIVNVVVSSVLVIALVIYVIFKIGFSRKGYE